MQSSSTSYENQHLSLGEEDGEGTVLLPWERGKNIVFTYCHAFLKNMYSPNIRLAFKIMLTSNSKLLSLSKDINTSCPHKRSDYRLHTTGYY